MEVVEEVIISGRQWLQRFDMPSESDTTVINEVCDRLQPLLALSDYVQPEWVRMVPTRDSAWHVVPTVDSLSNDRWTGIQVIARALGERAVFVVRLDSDETETALNSSTTQAYRIPVNLSYAELENSAVLDPINILWSNEVEHIIVGESGAWAFWTVTGSRADASVLSFSRQDLDPELARVWLGLDLDGWPNFGRLQLSGLTDTVITTKDRSNWVLRFPGKRSQKIGAASEVRKFLTGQKFEWVFDDVSSTEFIYKYSPLRSWSSLWRNRD